MLRKMFKNMSFRRKCFLACLLASMIPLTTLGVFCYRQMRANTIDREKTTLQDTLLRESISLDEKLNRLQQGMHYICWNNTLMNALRSDYSQVSDMYLFYRDTLDPLLASAEILNPEINNVTLYTDITIFPHGSSLRPLTDLGEEPWLEVVCQDYLDHWVADSQKKTLFLASQIYDLPDARTALVKMDFGYDSTFSSLTSLFDHAYGILLTDSEGNTIYEYHTADMAERALTFAQMESATDDYVVESASEIGPEWTLWLYRPMDVLLAPVQGMAVTIWTIVGLCIVFVVFVAFLLSSGTVRPLENLTNHMKQVCDGNLLSHADYESADEIGTLTQSFNQMVTRLNSLVEQLIQEKVLQKEFELKALQAQINPHFLYNSLSLINSKAIMADQMEISQMAQFLSTYYRTTLNKGKSITIVQNELENVRSYVRIQLLLHNHSFGVEYDIAEDILAYSMPNLLLQPLVENAIEHGLDHLKFGKKGVLRITGSLEGDTIVFRVSDNGPGIPAEKMNSILQVSANSGYGVPNVHQRVQLLFGSEYGLSYESSASGTSATLRLPVKPPEETKTEG